MPTTVWNSLQGQPLGGLMCCVTLLCAGFAVRWRQHVQGFHRPHSAPHPLTAGLAARYPRLPGALAASALSVAVGALLTQSIYTGTQALHADAAASCAGSDNPICSPKYLADDILSTPVGWTVFTLFQICFVGTVAVHTVEAARPGMHLFAGANFVLCSLTMVMFSTNFLICWLPCLWVCRALQAPSSKAAAASRRPVHMTASEAACVGCGMLALAVMSALQLLDTPRSWTIYMPAGMLLTGARGLFVHVPALWRRLAGTRSSAGEERGDPTSSSLPSGGSTPAATMLRALAVVLAAWHVGMIVFFARAGWPFEDLWAVITAAEQHPQFQGAYIVWVDAVALMLTLFAYLSYQWPAPQHGRTAGGGALGRCVRAASSALILGPGAAWVLAAAEREEALLAAAAVPAKDQRV